MLNIVSIDHALKKLAYNGRFRINAHQVAYLSGNSDVNEVYNYLVSREPYLVKRSYEVLCPDRMDSARSYDSLDKIPKSWIECRICGEEFIPDLNQIHIVFNFTNEYISQVTKEIENEKKQERPLMTIY